MDRRAAERVFGDRLGMADRYAELLGTSAVDRGLIGPREADRIWERHILNCAVVQELIPPHVEVADVGSGAGLPGLVLAIARPDLRVSLVEPLLRRTTWLHEAVATLGLSTVTVIRDRADALGATGRRFDVVTARAVAPLPRLLHWCIPLLRPGGRLLAMKGGGATRELTEAEQALRMLNVASSSIETCGATVVVPSTTVVRIDVAVSPRPRTASP